MILMIFQDYFSASSQLHRTQTNALLSLYGIAVKKGLEEDGDQGKVSVEKSVAFGLIAAG